MLNYEIDPSLLAGYVPAGCELDSWAGRTFMSVVGFEFLNTRVQVYGENYVSLAMRHSADMTADAGSVTLAYQWHRLGAWEGLSVCFSGSPTLPLDDREETFISEHYWGYSRQRDGTSIEYRVEHTRCRVWRAAAASLHCEVTSLYGSEFVEALSASPSTAFVAEGSPVVVC